MTSWQQPVSLGSVCYDDCEPRTVALGAPKPYCDGKTAGDEMRIRLQEMQAACDIIEIVKTPTGYFARDSTKHGALAS